jgi:hypothetical protein
VRSVADISVPSVNRFVANGIVVHNSIPKPKPSFYLAERSNEKGNVLGWKFTEVPRSTPGAIEGFSSRNNVRKGFVPKKDHVWVSLDYCLAKGTKILMADRSNLPIEAVCVGDMVKTPIGPKRVARAFKTSRKRVYKVNVSNGRSVRCSGEHKFMIDEGGTLVWKEARKLSPGDKVFAAWDYS